MLLLVMPGDDCADVRGGQTDDCSDGCSDGDGDGHEAGLGSR